MSRTEAPALAKCHADAHPTRPPPTIRTSASKSDLAQPAQRVADLARDGTIYVQQRGPNAADLQSTSSKSDLERRRCRAEAANQLGRVPLFEDYPIACAACPSGVNVAVP